MIQLTQDDPLYILRGHSMCGSRGGRGQGVRTPPLKNHKNIGFSSSIDPDLLKFTKLPSQHSMVGHYRHTSEMPFSWPTFSGISILSISSTKKNNNISVGPPLTKLSGSQHAQVIFPKHYCIFTLKIYFVLANRSSQYAMYPLMTD